ncbi:MAG: methyltransferase [bacterium]
MDHSTSEIFFRLLRTEPAPHLRAWLEAALLLEDHTQITDLAQAFTWARVSESLVYEPAENWKDIVIAAGLIEHQSLELLEHVCSQTPDDAPERFLEELYWRERALDSLSTKTEDLFANHLISSADVLVATLSCLRDTRRCPHAIKLLELVPELEALTFHRADHITSEHEPSNSTKSLPILEHVVDRVLGRKLRGLELEDIEVFQREPTLTQLAFDAELTVFDNIRQMGLLPALRTTLMFLDFSKGGSDTARASWIADGIDLSVHNEASATILQRHGILRRFPRFRGSSSLEDLIIELVRAHGLTGQAIRGECSLMVFEHFLRWLRRSAPVMAHALGMDESGAIDAVIDLLHLVNLCDTAGVREGLYDDMLRIDFISLEMLLRRVARSDRDITQELLHFERYQSTENDALIGEREIVWLTHRLLRLRKGRINAGEPSELTSAAVRSMPIAVVRKMVDLMARCQFWYVEAATSALSPQSQLRILYSALINAERDPAVDTSTMFHITFLPLVRDLDRSDQPAAPYRVRLIEALLRRVDIVAIAEGAPALPDDVLGSFEVELGGRQSHAVRFEASVEAQALLTLLPAYEKKSSAAFHATLKTLCDLYGLRKDEFDRLANEDTYLDHMNAARSDKERMLDYVVPGCIVEIGPGGGVVLDLLEMRFPDSDIVGVDVSKLVVESLRLRGEAEKCGWRVIEADAFDLPKHLPPNSVNTVILCSVLHEIYSYVEREIDGVMRRFRLESVRDLLRACYATLAPGGRIVIRDGIMPVDDARIIEFIDPDGPEFFRLFQDQFEGRPICGEWLDEKRVRLGAADAMEFLYCYTWGPSSFPYEVREQYGVLPYEDYLSTILAWLSDGEHPPRAVKLPPGEFSYLQQGYIDGLAPKIRLYDGAFQAVDLPDSNALMVIEKT